MGIIERIFRRVLRFSTAGPALTRYYLLPHVKLHRIHTSDAEFHTHPWNGVSLILGSYHEERVGESRKNLRFLFNRVFANTPHKVTVKRPVWTLFVHGKRVNETWSYGNKVKPWEGSDQEREALDL